MTKMTAESSAVTRLATDVFAPATFESLFWRPRYLIDSPVVSHLPLLFWVCAALRPSNTAVVGAGDGVAHFALCQAIDRFNGQGRCSGYGFWKEAASGGTALTIPPKLMNHQEMLYEEISHLIPSQDPDAVADGLGEGALDLLWLDLAATPGGLGQRADLFSRALNRTGLMFIHGIRAISDEGADSAALKRLIKSKRCVRFNDEKGLLLVAFDGDVPTRIEALLTTAKSAAPAPEVERVFRRVGQGLVSSVRAENAVVAKKNAEKKAADLSAARDSAEGALEEIKSAYELKNKKYAEFQSELFDERVIVAELKAQIAQIQGDHNSFQAAQAQTSLEAEQQLEAVRAEAGELRDQLMVAEEDSVALETAHQAALIEAEQQLEAVRAEAGELRDQLMVAEEDSVALETAHQAALIEAEQQLEAVRAEAGELRDQLMVAEEDSVALETAHQAALIEAEQQLEAVCAEAGELRDQLMVAEEDSVALETAHQAALIEAEQQLEAVRAEAGELRDQLMVAEEDSVALETAHQAALIEAEQQLEAVRAEAGELRDQLMVAEEDSVALETAHQAALIEAEQQLEAVRAEAGELRDQLMVAEEDSVALETAHQAALVDAEKLKALFEQTLNSERATRFSETASLTRMAEDLRLEVATLSSQNTDLTTNLKAAETSLKLVETKLKTDISNEKRVRFKETATLTRMIEALKAESERKKRPLEVFLIKQLVRSDKKLNKYHRNRTAFFSDSSSLVARLYFRMRSGS